MFPTARRDRRARPALVALSVLVLVVAACTSVDPDVGEGDGSSADETATAEDLEVGPDGELVTATPAEDAEPPGTTLPPDAIIIGSIMAETGLLANADLPALEGARIQVERINERGGVMGRPLVLRQIDSRTQLNTTFMAANELVEDGAVMLMVTCDVDFARPALEVAREHGLLTVTPCSGDVRWADGSLGPLVFSMAPQSAGEGRLVAEAAIADGRRRAAVFADATLGEAVSACQGFRSRFREQRGFISFDRTVDQITSQELEGTVDRLKSTLPPDFLLLCATPVVAANILNGLREEGVSLPVIGTSTLDGEDWFIQVDVIDDLSILTYASVRGDDPDPDVRALVDDYVDRTGSLPATGSPVTGADTIEAFAIAAERADSFDSAILAAELETFDQIDLIGGAVTFTPQSHIPVLRSMRLMRVVKNKLQFDRMLTPSAEITDAPAEPVGGEAEQFDLDAVPADPTTTDGGVDAGAPDTDGGVDVGAPETDGGDDAGGTDTGQVPDG